MGCLVLRAELPGVLSQQVALVGLALALFEDSVDLLVRGELGSSKLRILVRIVILALLVEVLEIIPVGGIVLDHILVFGVALHLMSAHGLPSQRRVVFALIVVLEVQVLAVVLQGVAGLLLVFSLGVAGEVGEAGGLAMLLHVVGQHTGLQELGVTVATHEWPFSLVLLLVILQLTELGEAGVAVGEVALEGFLAVVHA